MMAAGIFCIIGGYAGVVISIGWASVDLILGTATLTVDRAMGVVGLLAMLGLVTGAVMAALFD